MEKKKGNIHDWYERKLRFKLLAGREKTRSIDGACERKKQNLERRQSHASSHRDDQKRFGSLDGEATQNRESAIGAF